MAQIRIDDDTKKSFENLKIEVAGIKVTSANDKLNHLLWFFKNYKNNNHKKSKVDKK